MRFGVWHSVWTLHNGRSLALVRRTADCGLEGRLRGPEDPHRLQSLAVNPTYTHSHTRAQMASITRWYSEDITDSRAAAGGLPDWRAGWPGSAPARPTAAVGGSSPPSASSRRQRLAGALRPAGVGPPLGAHTGRVQLHRPAVHVDDLRLLAADGAGAAGRARLARLGAPPAGEGDVAHGRRGDGDGGRAVRAHGARAERAVGGGLAGAAGLPRAGGRWGRGAQRHQTGGRRRRGRRRRQRGRPQAQQLHGGGRGRQDVSPHRARGDGGQPGGDEQQQRHWGTHGGDSRIGSDRPRAAEATQTLSVRRQPSTGFVRGATLDGLTSSVPPPPPPRPTTAGNRRRPSGHPFPTVLPTYSLLGDWHRRRSGNPTSDSMLCSLLPTHWCWQRPTRHRSRSVYQLRSLRIRSARHPARGAAAAWPYDPAPLQTGTDQLLCCQCPAHSIIAGR